MRLSYLLSLAFPVVVGCSSESGSDLYFPPVDKLAKGDESGVWVMAKDPLPFGAAAIGEFAKDQQVFGWFFDASSAADIGLEVTRSGTSTKLDTRLLVYGPVNEQGEYPTAPVDYDEDSGWGKNAKLGLVLEAPGRYLAAVTTNTGDGRGKFRLELKCIGGDPSQCQPPVQGSCMGRCGESVAGGCFCDSECGARGDCCVDVSWACEFRATELDSSWLEFLSPEFQKDYFTTLIKFVNAEYQAGPVYPPQNLTLNALIRSGLDDVRVVILGQDPYVGAGQAHGLSFSVPQGVEIPPSLRNILKEIAQDIKSIDPESNSFKFPPSGNLEPWADQGVLLLNAALTVREGEPNSHAGQGWEIFTDKIISTISEQKEHVVFLLWGKYAQSKTDLIDASKHLVLKAAHPSPLSVNHGFFGCRHFSQADSYLESHGQAAIDWHDSLWNSPTP